MNLATLEPLRRQAEHNESAGWSWCLTHPEKLRELLGELEDLSNRLAHIHALAR